MKSNYKIGDLIEIVDNKNTNLECTNLKGLSMTKEFRPSTSNIVGTDLSKYKIVKQNQFAVDFMSAIRVHRMPIALNRLQDDILISPAYAVFQVKDEKVILTDYLMMWFSRSEFDRYADFRSDAAIRGGYGWNELCDTEIFIPDILTQRKIVDSYNVITNRIALKQKINDNLEAQMGALFDELVISKDNYEFSESLDDNIDFVNGLAMQNFRPEDGETSLPVIKIRELSQGYCDTNSEYCSDNIDITHIIYNGDLVFSWSGSLQAAFWTSKTAGLNQHLFKVQSTKYPIWFVYRWVIFHLLNFQRIAENKGTTFGHIKREDLHNAKIKSIDAEELRPLNRVFAPILEAKIANATELHSLMELQNVILSRLSR